MGDDLPPGTKRCPSCPPGAPPKPLEDFTPDKRKPDGRTTICRACLAKRRRDKRAAQRDAGIPPPPGKKARARKRVVIQLDDHRSSPASKRTGSQHDEQPRTWYPEPPGPDADTTWYAAFLERLAETRNVADAAEHALIHRRRVYDALVRDARFAEAFQWAKDESRDRVEATAWHRALEGWDEDVWFDGEVVGTKRVYDAAMLRLILQGVAPEYRRGPSVAVQVNTQINGSDVRQKLVSKIDEYASRSG